MYKVERAIIMAAGFGSRMVPVTLSTPKPLVKVNGVRIIDTIIEALYKNSINEIYIVVGYLKEKFNDLLKEYPNITLIENLYYDKCNNISSLYCAREYIKNAIIIDGDQIIKNYQILTPYFEKSGYLSSYTKEHTNEWLQTVDDNNYVLSCSRNGGENGWRLYGISKWNEEDAMKLKKCIEYEFEIKKNRDVYWDDIAMFFHKEEFKLKIYPIKDNDIIEIDSYDELKEIDSSYK